MTTELSDVVKELSDAFENRVYPDADAVMKSLKDLDDYLKPYEKCDIHEIWYGDGELVNALFHLVATNAKHYYTQAWYGCISMIIFEYEMHINHNQSTLEWKLEKHLLQIREKSLHQGQPAGT
jgi:hypothetical protein